MVLKAEDVLREIESAGYQVTGWRESIGDGLTLIETNHCCQRRSGTTRFKNPGQSCRWSLRRRPTLAIFFIRTSLSATAYFCASQNRHKGAFFIAQNHDITQR